MGESAAFAAALSCARVRVYYLCFYYFVFLRKRYD
jgi:hypothetical protein